MIIVVRCIRVVWNMVIDVCLFGVVCVFVIGVIIVIIISIVFIEVRIFRYFVNVILLVFERIIVVNVVF